MAAGRPAVHFQYVQMSVWQFHPTPDVFFMQTIFGKGNLLSCRLGMSLCTQDADVKKKTENRVFLFFWCYAGKHVTFPQQQHQQRWLTTSLSTSLSTDCCWNCVYRAFPIWSAINMQVSQNSYTTCCLVLSFLHFAFFMFHIWCTSGARGFQPVISH